VQSCILAASACAYFGRIGEARANVVRALERAALLGTPFHRAFGAHMAAQV
jgi:hypothetical protein